MSSNDKIYYDVYKEYIATHIIPVYENHPIRYNMIKSNDINSNDINSSAISARIPTPGSPFKIYRAKRRN